MPAAATLPSRVGPDDANAVDVFVETDPRLHDVVVTRLEQHIERLVVERADRTAIRGPDMAQQTPVHLAVVRPDHGCTACEGDDDASDDSKQIHDSPPERNW
jgi:hypothetical protein